MAVGVAVLVAVAVFVAVAVGVGVSVATAVFVAVAVGVAVPVAVAVLVGVAVSVATGVFVAVAVGVGVFVATAVFVAVAVGVGVLVATAVFVAVAVAVAVLVAVAVSVAVAVGAVIGLPAQGVSDLISGQASSWQTYVAAGVGGAAGGEAALYCSGSCAGAAAGASSNLTRQLLNGTCCDLGSLAGDTAVTSVSAGVFAAVLPPLAKLLPNSIKGDIGETTSLIYNWLKGSTLLDTQGNIPGFSTIPDSTWVSWSGDLYYVESKFGTSGLTSAQRLARDALGDAYVVERWGYDWVARVGANLGDGLGLGYLAFGEGPNGK